jgi:3-dehydrosphinganine reductase
VIKPSNSAPRRTNRQSPFTRDATQEQLQQALEEELHHPRNDDEDLVDGGDGDEADEADEAKSDIEDHDGQHHLDLSTAANILANGPAIIPGTGSSSNGGGPDPSIHPALQVLDQAAAQAQAAQAQAQAHAHAVHPHNHNHTAAFALEAMDPNQVTGTAEEVALESGYNDINIDSALGKRLAREPGLRMAVQRRNEQILNLKRRSNVEALLAHVTGTVTASPCKNCHKGHGPWNLCVVVDGQMCGSCANCWYNASGSRCSFHGK